MPLSSKKISRLEKEAFLRSKDFEYKREQASHILTNYQDEETFENERHRRYDIIRQTHQIQREIDHQVGLIDKLNERRQQELQKKPKPITTTRPYLSSLSSSSTSSASSSTTDRPSRAIGTTDKYTSKKHTSGDKLQ